jgi:hypothetical protein
MSIDCISSDDFGRYAADGDRPGPALMEADTLLGNDATTGTARIWTSGVHRPCRTPSFAPQVRKPSVLHPVEEVQA